MSWSNVKPGDRVISNDRSVFGKVLRLEPDYIVFEADTLLGVNLELGEQAVFPAAAFVWEVWRPRVGDCVRHPTLGIGHTVADTEESVIYGPSAIVEFGGNFRDRYSVLLAALTPVLDTKPQSWRFGCAMKDSHDIMLPRGFTEVMAWAQHFYQTNPKLRTNLDRRVTAVAAIKSFEPSAVLKPTLGFLTALSENAATGSLGAGGFDLRKTVAMVTTALVVYGEALPYHCLPLRGPHVELRVTRLDSDRVEVQDHPLGGRRRYFLRPSDDLLAVLDMVEPVLRKRILDHELIELDGTKIHHLMLPRSPYDLRSTPRFSLRDAFAETRGYNIITEEHRTPSWLEDRRGERAVIESWLNAVMRDLSTAVAAVPSEADLTIEWADALE